MCAYNGEKNKMAKVKLVDIAKEVGCSTATVSYVLNNDPKQKINEETRRKTLQVSSLLGYQKNPIANALATGRTNCIGFYVGKSPFPLAIADKMAFLSNVIDALSLNGYHSILLSGTISKEIQFVDAIVCLDFSEDDFAIVCKNNFIPVLGVDTHVHEPWIFEISSVVADIKEKYYLSDYALLHYDLNSTTIKSKILEGNKNTYFISSFEQLSILQEQLKDKKIIVYGDAMYDYLKMNWNGLINYATNPSKKINKLINCLKLAIDHTDVDCHVYSID